MQNKGALTFLAVILAIACAYQLSFTFVARNVEKKAAVYAAGDQEKERYYLDSIKSKDVYNLGLISFKYKQVKDKEINLGLDLRGGMNVMLQIQVEDIVRALANDSKDPAFNQAIASAKAAQAAGSADFIGSFAQAYNEASGGARLSTLFNTSAMRGKIEATSSNDDVIKILRAETTSAIDNSYNVLRSRIDRFGVTQPNIQRLDNGRILVELPGVKEPERVRKLLQGTASLEFWSTYDNQEIYPLLAQANTAIKELNSMAAGQTDTTVTAVNPVETAINDITATDRAGVVAQLDSLSALSELGAQEQVSEKQARENMAKEYPLFSKLSPSADMASGQVASGPIVGQALASDTSAINKMLSTVQVQSLLQRDLKLMWGNKAIDDAERVYQLYAIRANTPDGKAPLDGGVIVSAQEGYSERGSSAKVSMTMNAAGARTWARLTADNVGRSIAIVLDGYVYSAPTVNGEITGGNSEISGQFTIEEARDLANVLKSGKLPAPARIVQDTVVGPTLGQESINSSMMSFVIAFVLVLLYMIFFYNKAGVVASIALITNLFFLFGVLVSFGAVLTLPGIAGIVLTMGMAVDANVIIYERIKEELRAGKGINQSIKEGYSNAMSAIIDSNLTSMITGIVLFIFGTGPVQGFATTLIIGIITSFFTAIFISRIIFETMLKKEWKISFSNRFTENFLSKTKFDFLKVRKVTYSIAAILILISVFSIATKGMNYGVDFSGGRAYVIQFDQDVAPNEVRESLQAVFNEVEGEGANVSVEVKQYGISASKMRVITQYKFDDDSQDATAEVEGLLYKALNPLYANPITLEEFTSTATNPNGIITADKVGPSVASDITRNSFIAVFFSMVAIGAYIIFRFRRWQWGVSSVIALSINSFLTIGVFSLFWGILPFSMEIDQSFIAAILTIIGYAINDNVIIFDRIREYHLFYPKRSNRENINNALNSTLSRTVNTAGTTLVVLLAIFLFGGDVIRGFIFALMFGVFAGVLSTLFIAVPIAFDLINNQDKREAAKELGVSKAKA